MEDTLVPYFNNEKEYHDFLAKQGTISRQINDNPDSLEIGTPAKGGAIKIYGNYDDPESFKDKVDKAISVRLHAQTALEEN
jgi:hypothetical protein